MDSVYSSKVLKKQVLWLLAAVLFSSLCYAETSRKQACHDAEGNSIPDGSNFIPDKKDPCQTCQCEDGYSIMCTAVSCSPPDCIFKAIDGKCCEFVCEGPQPSYPQVPGANGTGRTKPIDRTNGGITNLGLRLVASTITSFLVLALLLFMIHKLRQRRLFMSVRRLNSSRRRLDEVDHERYMNDMPPPLGLTVPPYQDPPPPYSPPKPPCNIAPGEPPPPYEAINNNNTAPPQDASDLPPAYQQGAPSLPYIGAANSRTHTTSESSFTSDSEFLGPQFSPINNPARNANNRNQNEQRNRSLNESGSVEDTRVKELFEQSWRSAQRSHGSLANASTNSVKPQQSACKNARSAHESQAAQQGTPSNSRSQHVINIFGPRCIKKSGSVEILRQSISPRNSYCLDGISAAEVMSQSLDPSVLNRMLQETGISSPNTSVNGMESTSGLQNLTSETDTSLTSDPSNGSSCGMSSLLRQMDARDRRRQFRLSNLLHSPVESTESPTSPLSPAGENSAALRSNSIHSDLSWFSVCSETGEPRLRKSVITSDSKYPEYRPGGKPATGTQVSCKFVPKIPTPSENMTQREDNSVEPKTEFNFPNLCLARNYSTERFDRLGNLVNSSVVHRSLSDIDLNRNRCRRENQELGDCTCKSCDKGTHSSELEPWVMKTTNQNTQLTSKNQSAFSVDDIKSGKRKDGDAPKGQSFKSFRKAEKALSVDSANGNDSLFRNINKFGPLGGNHPKSLMTEGKTVKSTNNRDCDNSTVCAKPLTKSPKKLTKTESVITDLRNNKRNRKASDSDKKVHKTKSMLCSDV